jgi:hypothetical protein
MDRTYLKFFGPSQPSLRKRFSKPTIEINNLKINNDFRSHDKPMTNKFNTLVE